MAEGKSPFPTLIPSLIHTQLKVGSAPGSKFIADSNDDCSFESAAVF